MSDEPEGESPHVTPASSVAARPPTWTNDTVVSKYIQLRDRIAEVRKRQAAEMKVYTDALYTMGYWLLEDLTTRKEESVRTKAGTFFRSIRTTCKVEGWQQTLDYIIEHQAWDLLEARVSKTAATQIMEDTQQPIPGLNITQEYVINVRKPTA